MTTEILMPALSPPMEEGKLAKWLVKEGDKVSAGDIIAEIETDKATMEFEAVDEGILAKIIVAEGTEGVLVNSPIAMMANEATESTVDLQPIEKNVQTDASSTKTEFKSQEAPLSGIEAEWGAEIQTKTQTVREAIRDAMAEEMRRDETVYPPITEHGFTGIAVGSAFAGLRPIVEFMTFNFSMQAIDQIVNSAAKTLYMSGGQMGAPMVFRGPNGAAARVGAQHSQDYAAWYAHIPGLKVVQPYSASDAKGLMKTAIRDDNPVIFLENEILYGKSFEVPLLEDYTVPFGKARVWREGTDVTIVSFGIGMQYALEASNQLEAEGVSVEVIDLRSLRPIDYETIINSIEKTNRCITVEEGFPIGSIGNHLSAVIMERAFDYLDAPVINCTGKDVPMPYAANLEKLALTTTAEVISAVKKVIYK